MNTYKIVVCSICYFLAALHLLASGGRKEEPKKQTDILYAILYFVAGSQFFNVM